MISDGYLKTMQGVFSSKSSSSCIVGKLLLTAISYYLPLSKSFGSVNLFVLMIAGDSINFSMKLFLVRLRIGGSIDLSVNY